MATNHYQLNNYRQKEQIRFILNQKILQSEQEKYQKYNNRIDSQIKKMNKTDKSLIATLDKRASQKINNLFQPQYQESISRQNSNYSEKSQNLSKSNNKNQRPQSQPSQNRPNLLRYSNRNQAQNINEDDPFSKISQLNASI